jgi:hypothetical protein
LSKLGYNEFRHSESVFWRERDGLKVFLLIYVDDVLVLTASTKAAQDVTAKIAKLYNTKDLDKVDYFLGIKFDYVSSNCQLPATITVAPYSGIAYSLQYDRM